MSESSVSENLLWGIDLGGTKIELGVIRQNAQKSGAPEVVYRKRIATERDKGYAHIVAGITRLVREASDELGMKPQMLGMGTPGAICPDTGCLRNSNTLCLNGMPLRDDVAEAVGCPVVIENDANCFALAEQRWGAAQGLSTVFGVILGTGVGGGVVVNNRLLSGLQGLGGEWGHTVLDPRGEPCYCGKSGCVETFLSGPSVEQRFEKAAGMSRTAAELYACWKDPEVDAEVDKQVVSDLFADYFEKVAWALSQVINILDPDGIVLGGGLSNIDELYQSKLHQRLEFYVFNKTCKTPILRHALGDSAGVFGAAALCGANPTESGVDVRAA